MLVSITGALPEGGTCVGYFKKGLLCILAVLVFLGVSAGFVKLLQGNLPGKEAPQLQQDLSAFPRAVTVPAETTVETTQPETVPETLPPETLPPVETVPRVVYESVPLFYMTDHPEIRFRTGTVATSGSCIASLAMVSSYLTGNEYRVEELAEYFANYIGNNMQWLEYASDTLQLPWKKAENFHVAKQALQEGKVVIALLGDRSLFARSQHFVVLTGISENGKISVNDPYEPHYTQWNLQKPLAEGFQDISLTTGYQAAWIYDPEAMGETPFVYEPAPNPDAYRYPGITLTEGEIDLMAKLLCMEAGSEPFEGQQAIAEVILNRLAAGNFQSSIHNIIHAQDQFKAADRLYLAEPTHIQYEAIDRALNGPYVLPIDVVFFATYKVNDNVWGTIGAHTFCYQW